MSARHPGRTAAEALYQAWAQLPAFHSEGGPPLSMVDLEALLSRVAPGGEVRVKALHALRLHLAHAGADCLRPARLDFWLRNASRATLREALARAGATAALLHLDELLPQRFTPHDRWDAADLVRLLRVECRAIAYVERLAVNELEAVLPEHPLSRLRPGLERGWEEADHAERLVYVRAAAYRHVPRAAEVLGRASRVAPERFPAAEGPTREQLFALLPEAGAVGLVLERAERALTLRLAEAAREGASSRVAALRTKDTTQAAAVLSTVAVTAALLGLEERFCERSSRREDFDLPALRALLEVECAGDEARVEACVAELRELFLSALAPLDEDDASPEAIFEDWLSEAAAEEAEDLIHRAAHRTLD